MPRGAVIQLSGLAVVAGEGITGLAGISPFLGLVSHLMCSAVHLSKNHSQLRRAIKNPPLLMLHHTLNLNLSMVGPNLKVVNFF